MIYGSVCSGIEAATVAWHSLGWRPAWFSEIERFPSAVLAHHYPDVPNHGDMTRFQEWPDAAIDLLVGGTPCQSFSVAGLRRGLVDPRGNLMLTYLAIAERFAPRWLVWENVPGVLSSNGGRDFGTLLGCLAELGYGFAYRVLDAQFFGVAQRRRRVFVVGHAGDWRRAAAVLFERDGLQGHPEPRRAPGKGLAYGFAGGATDGVAKPLGAHALSKGRGTDLDNTTYIAEPFVLMERGRDGGLNLEYRCDGTANALLTPSGGRGGLGIGAIAFDAAQITSATNRTRAAVGLPVPTLTKESRMHVAGSVVRRLTPRECERLQGFPDDYTRIEVRGKPAADGPRYKALGNSMAVPVMRWIGARIALVDALAGSAKGRA
ncbi:DNA cytosine methyltransferase [Burkholderia ubonensis]|uniref:DNA cytosine methyltransferase n=1 Tax=Burkholderia ubonensis TaxID=101571 RepID=UPI0009B32C9D|nr:DNA cytosine methyltransferase [Burkholderia ubonensis]